MLNFKNAFSSLQKIGKCMMLPVSVLPVAGILLGAGSANFSWLPHIVSQVMAQSGGAITRQLRRLGITAVYVTHDVAEAFALGGSSRTLSYGVSKEADAPLAVERVAVGGVEDRGSDAVATMRSQSACLVTSMIAKTACPPSCWIN